ncbi:MAG TPA: SAM-dependent methyltransferase [Xanthobacteraceae bacterium]|nr:SAM-dependent methyltransferase [Xanthobacteraceae bacterium]
MPKEFSVRPIGYVKSAREEPIDDGWDRIETRIELDAKELEPDAVLGLSDFSHIEVVFLFDRADPAKACRGARRSRGREDWPLTGILAQRSKDRPNRIGVTMCRLLKVEKNILHVEGLDAIDGTPVLDIKPVMRGFLPRGEIREPKWAHELMAGYWK